MKLLAEFFKRSRASQPAPILNEREEHKMHIEILRTARRFHLQPEVAQCFIDAGLAREVVREAVATPALTPRWTVNQHEISRIPFITCTLGARVEIFDGNPEYTHEVFTKMGLQCPSEIAERYVSLLKKTGRWGQRG